MVILVALLTGYNFASLKARARAHPEP
jgi:hypothetical protein